MENLKFFLTSWKQNASLNLRNSHSVNGNIYSSNWVNGNISEWIYVQDYRASTLWKLTVGFRRAFLKKVLTGIQTQNSIWAAQKRIGHCAWKKFRQLLEAQVWWNSWSKFDTRERNSHVQVRIRNNWNNCGSLLDRSIDRCLLEENRKTFGFQFDLLLFLIGFDSKIRVNLLLIGFKQPKSLRKKICIINFNPKL